MPEGQRIPYPVISDFINEVLSAVGADNEQAKIFANALLWSDLIGRADHGVWRLGAYVHRIRTGSMKCPCSPSLQARTQAVNIMDGDQGIGHYIGHTAMLHAVSKAKLHGIGAVGVHNSNHFGAGAYFVQLAAERNMIGLAMSNSVAKVAPYGGVRAVFGTNPFSFAAPGHDADSMLLDMTTATVSGSSVMRFVEAGLSLPDGTAIDHEGQAILDPKDLDKGALLNFGGARGSGLAMMIEILCCVLTGAMFSTEVNPMFRPDSGAGGNGHFFIAINVAHFMDIDIFKTRLKNLFLQIRRSGINPGDVLIPGESRWRAYHHNLESGIPLDGPTLEILEKLAEDVHVTPIFTASHKVGMAR